VSWTCHELARPAALGAAVAETRGEILVFTDANSAYERDAVRRLVRPFADPSVGGGRRQPGLPAAVRPSGEGSAAGERGYWNADRLFKTAESAAGSVVSATGAIYAIRRELFSPVHDDVSDDFHETLAVIDAGRRFVFRPRRDRPRARRGIERPRVRPEGPGHDPRPALRRAGGAASPIRGGPASSRSSSSRARC
jgi:hypothetical protein